MGKGREPLPILRFTCTSSSVGANIPTQCSCLATNLQLILRKQLQDRYKKHLYEQPLILKIIIFPDSFSVVRVVKATQVYVF